MKKLDLGQSITMLANLGVIAGIVFLGFELRQTRLAIEDSSHLSSVVLSQDPFDRLWEPGLTAAHEAGFENFNALNNEQKRQSDAYVSQRLNLWEYAFYSHRRGTMDEELWAGWDSNFREQIHQKLWREIWKLAGPAYGESFRAYVETILAVE